MDVIYRRGRATAAEVLEDIPDPPSYSAVRAMLRLLEEKGHVRHEQDGPRYVFLPIVNRDRARKSALTHVVRTFFDGSATEAVAALLNDGGKAQRRRARSALGDDRTSTGGGTMSLDTMLATLGERDRCALARRLGRPYRSKGRC